MFDSVIRAGAVVDRAILDKEVVVGQGAIVGEGPYDGPPNRQEPGRLNTGITVVGKQSLIPRGARLGRNVRDRRRRPHVRTTRRASSAPAARSTPSRRGASAARKPPPREQPRGRPDGSPEAKVQRRSAAAESGASRVDSRAMSSADPAPRPRARPTSRAGLPDLGLEPASAAEREGIVAWDLVLDGRRRRDLRVTLILDPAIGVSSGPTYAPPLATCSAVYRTLLRWNDEFPLVKFSSRTTGGRCSPSRSRPRRRPPMSSASRSPAARVADRFFDESRGWLKGGGWPTAPVADGAEGPGSRLLDRYADASPSSSHAPLRPRTRRRRRSGRRRRGARVTRRAPVVLVALAIALVVGLARTRRRHRPGHRLRGRRDRPHPHHRHVYTVQPAAHRVRVTMTVTARNRPARRRHAGSGSTTRSSPSCRRASSPRISGTRGGRVTGPEPDEGRRAAPDRLREPAVQRQEAHVQGQRSTSWTRDARRPRDPRRPEPRHALPVRGPRVQRREGRHRHGPRPGGLRGRGRERDVRQDHDCAATAAPSSRRRSSPSRSSSSPTSRPRSPAEYAETPLAVQAGGQTIDLKLSALDRRSRWATASATCSRAACRPCATRSGCRGRTRRRSPSRRRCDRSSSGYAALFDPAEPDRGRLLGRSRRGDPRGCARLVQRLAPRGPLGRRGVRVPLRVTRGRSDQRRGPATRC